MWHPQTDVRVTIYSKWKLHLQNPSLSSSSFDTRRKLSRESSYNYSFLNVHSFLSAVMEERFNERTSQAKIATIWNAEFELFLFLFLVTKTEITIVRHENVYVEIIQFRNGRENIRNNSRLQKPLKPLFCKQMSRLY